MSRFREDRIFFLRRQEAGGRQCGFRGSDDRQKNVKVSEEMRKRKETDSESGYCRRFPMRPGKYYAGENRPVSVREIFPERGARETPVPSGVFGKKAAGTALRFHKSLPEYRETPLISLSHLSRELGVGGIYVRMRAAGSDSTPLKGLGGAYAMFRILCRRLGLDPEKADFGTFRRRRSGKRVSQITFATATDGNPGKGVSRAAKLFGCSTPGVYAEGFFSGAGTGDSESRPGGSGDYRRKTMTVR